MEDKFPPLSASADSTSTSPIDPRLGTYLYPLGQQYRPPGRLDHRSQRRCWQHRGEGAPGCNGARWGGVYLFTLTWFEEWKSASWPEFSGNCWSATSICRRHPHRDIAACPTPCSYHSGETNFSHGDKNNWGRKGKVNHEKKLLLKCLVQLSSLEKLKTLFPFHPMRQRRIWGSWRTSRWISRVARRIQV